MKIDKALIIQLRNDKSWSQEELAVASGLNLRTIQRIENEGAISLQSKKALASVFDIEVNKLDFIEPDLTLCFEYKTVVFKSDTNWISGWGKQQKKEGFELDAAISEYGEKGWRVHTITYGTSVHGGAGQVMVLFERSYEN